jgi:hypothetical protein
VRVSCQKLPCVCTRIICETEACQSSRVFQQPLEVRQGWKPDLTMSTVASHDIQPT